MVEIKRIAGKKVVVLMGIVIGTAFLAVLFFLILSPGVNQVTHSEVSLNIQDPPINQTDLVMPLFRVTKNPNDFIEFENWSADSQFAEAPPEKECPADAEKALEPFGGMPRDAVFDSIKDASNGCIGNDYGEKCFVTSRMIVYRQKPYGMTIHGKAGGMMIELTAGGFPSRISKQWLTLEESGIDHIIPASEAMTRLRHGEGINVPPGPLDLTILSVEPAYYTPENLSNESYLEPVWAFNARDEIHQNALTLYVPAEKIPPSVELIPESGPGMSPNFTETGGTIPIADVSSASHVYVGTSGPVGEDAARESIRLFTASPALTLDYHGQSSKKNEGCGGQNYNWVFYDLTSGSCEFYVDTYTGSVIYAQTDRSCTAIGIPGLPQLIRSSPDTATQDITEFIKERYPLFEQRHMALQYHYTPDSYHSQIEYGFTGTDTNIEIVFDPTDGHLTHYAVYNSNLIGKCASSPSIAVIAVAIVVFLSRRRP